MNPTPAEIINHVCKSLELNKNMLIGNKREICECCGYAIKKQVYSNTKYTDARQIIIYMIRFYNPFKESKNKHEYSYAEIAKALGRTLRNGKGDHAFAMYSESKCRDFLESKNKAFIEKFKKCYLPTKPLVLPV